MNEFSPINKAALSYINNRISHLPLFLTNPPKNFILEKNTKIQFLVLNKNLFKKDPLKLSDNYYDSQNIIHMSINHDENAVFNVS